MLLSDSSISEQNMLKTLATHDNRTDLLWGIIYIYIFFF